MHNLIFSLLNFIFLTFDHSSNHFEHWLSSQRLAISHQCLLLTNIINLPCFSSTLLITFLNKALSQMGSYIMPPETLVLVDFKPLFNVLMLRLENWSLQAKFDLPFVFVEKVWLECLPHSFIYISIHVSMAASVLQWWLWGVAPVITSCKAYFSLLKFIAKACWLLLQMTDGSHRFKYHIMALSSFSLVWTYFKCYLANMKITVSSIPLDYNLKTAPKKEMKLAFFDIFGCTSLDF